MHALKPNTNPLRTKRRDKQKIRFALYRQDNWITFNEQELVSDMPSGLRADVITHVHASTISQIPWLEGKDKGFVADVVILLKPRLFMVNFFFVSFFSFFSLSETAASPLFF